MKIVDAETGELLGGKRAAIQYYYDTKYGSGDSGAKNREQMVDADRG